MAQSAASPPDLKMLLRQATDLEYEFTFTSKGNYALLCNGYKYVKNRDGRNGRVFWRCASRRSCRATARTIHDRVESVSRFHSHPPDYGNCLIVKLISRMRMRARTESTPIERIYREEKQSMLELCQREGVFCQLPDFQSVKSSLYRQRKRNGCSDDEQEEAKPPVQKKTPAAKTIRTLLEEEGESVELEELEERQRHQLKHRELFLSRQVETLPATHIRGKCSVTLLNETESPLSYVANDDTFFYSLVYDPQQKTVLADRGEIRVGSKHQAEVPPLLKDNADDGRSLDELEELVWKPDNGLSNKQVDQFLILSRSVGTFARALDCPSSVRSPALHMSAAAASRDITLLHSMEILHNCGYEMSRAMCALVPNTGPVLCRDEMEEWSVAEANLFEEALEKYGKEFNEIRQDLLPWKSLKSIIEYYYMWKTTERYVQQRRLKAVEQENKLKQVYIPNYNKPNPAALQSKQNGPVSGRPCEGCHTEESPQWYSWGSVNSHCRLCAGCWMYWKKYGGLKEPHKSDHDRPGPDARQGNNGQENGGLTAPAAERIAAMQSQSFRCSVQDCGKEFKLRAQLSRHCQVAHGFSIRGTSPKPVFKSRAAFFLLATPLTQAARRICTKSLKPRRAAKNPFQVIAFGDIKREWEDKAMDIRTVLAARRKAPMKAILELVYTLHPSMESVPKPDFLQRAPDLKALQPEKLAFPIPPPDKNPFLTACVLKTSPSILKKRSYEQANGVSESAPKRPHIDRLNDRKVSTNGRGAMMNGGPHYPGKKHSFNFADAPDDLFFRVTNAMKKWRRQLRGRELRRAARVPWRLIRTAPSSESSDVME